MSSTTPSEETDVEAQIDDQRLVGSEMKRVEDRDILTGDAEYVHDIAPPGTLHMALVRSVHPHATITEIDTSEAEEHPDCRLVLTAADLKEDYNPMPCGLDEFKEWPLADGKVRYVGEPIALVVAPDRYVAEDVADLIQVSYDKLEPVVDPMEARDDSVLVHEDVGTNVPDSEHLEFGDVEGAFGDADHVVEKKFSWGRISGVPMETAGVVGIYDEDTDSFDIHSNIQLHTLVDDTVYETLGYPPEKVNLEVPAHVGGSFGTKIAVHRYANLAAIASQQVGKPVKFVEDRVENLQGGDFHSSDREYDVAVALEDDGTIRGFDVRFVDDFGAFPRYPINQTLKPLAVLNNAYDVENVGYEYELVITNKTSQTAYRGFGVPPHIYVLEMILDEAADELGFDPVELRRQNLITPEKMPYKLPSGNIYDSGDYPEALEGIQEIVAENERVEGGLLDPEIVEERRAEGKYRGVRPTISIEPGVSGSDWTNRQRSDRDELPSRERDEVEELPEHTRGEVLEDGTVKAYIATDSAGQGHQTILVQMLADELDLPPEDIEVGYLGSAEGPTEYGSAASRMAVMLSGSAVGFAERLVANLEELAADYWECEESDVEYRSGGVDRIGDGDRLDLADLARIDRERDAGLTQAAYDYEHPATGFSEFDDALREKYPVYPTAAFAANAPIVEVDVTTGEVEILKFYSIRDAGTLINPMIVEGQAHGGMAQGIGAALLEEFEYDDEGQPRAVTLFDYLLPSIENVPEMAFTHTETPSPFTVSGAKGTGEGGMIDGPAAIAASVNAALEPFDVRVDTIPMTPHRLRKQLREAGQ